MSAAAIEDAVLLLVLVAMLKACKEDAALRWALATEIARGSAS